MPPSYRLVVAEVADACRVSRHAARTPLTALIAEARSSTSWTRGCARSHRVERRGRRDPQGPDGLHTRHAADRATPTEGRGTDRERYAAVGPLRRSCRWRAEAPPTRGG